MSRMAAAAALLVVMVAGPAAAQFGLFGPDPPPPPRAGAGSSVEEAVCSDPETTRFCAMIEAGRKNPVVARLYDPTFTGTVFVPMDAGFKDDGPKLARKLGAASVDNVLTNPTLAAQTVANHVIVGTALQFAQLKNGDKWRNALNQELKVERGFLGGAGSLLGGLYVKGPENTVRLRSTEGLNNVLAGQAYLHKVTGILIPPKP